METEKSWWKKATWDLRGQCENQVWWVEVPSEGGLAQEVSWEGLPIVTAHFHSTVWLFRSDGLCSATESPSFPHSCWRKGGSSCRGWSPWDSAHTQGTGKVLLAWAGTIQNPQALGRLELIWCFLQESQWYLQKIMLFRVIFRVPSKPSHHLPSFSQRFRKMAT